MTVVEVNRHGVPTPVREPSNQFGGAGGDLGQSLDLATKSNLAVVPRPTA